MQVKELITTPVATITIKADITQARALMKAKDISAVPVVNIMGDSIKLEGIVTYEDLSGVYDDTVNIKQVMTTRVFSIKPEDDIKDAAKIMLDKKIHHLIVMTNDKIVGILSSMDFVKLAVME